MKHIMQKAIGNRIGPDGGITKVIERGGTRPASGMGLREESGCLYENVSKCLVVNSPCTNSNNCYAIICRLCEEQLDLENKIVDITKNPTSKYLGTSARTLHARSREHIDLYNAKKHKQCAI